MDMDFSIGGYNIKGWMVAVALPVLSAVAGGVYWTYDVLNRFYDVEESVNGALSLESRLLTVELAVENNDVSGLNERLATLNTNMTTILEQQRTLLDMRSQVDRATTITDGLGDKLDIIDQEIDDIWEAYDYLKDNPLQ